MSKTKLKVYLDLTLFVAFVLISAPQLTGIPLHEWGGIIFIPFIIAHIVIDWKWIVSITQRLFQKLPRETRFNYLLDFLLFFAMTTVIVSGIAISQAALPVLGITLQNSLIWSLMHRASATLIMLIVGIHIAMHFKWVVSNANRYLFNRNKSKLPTMLQESN